MRESKKMSDSYYSIVFILYSLIYYIVLIPIIFQQKGQLTNSDWLFIIGVVASFIILLLFEIYDDYTNTMRITCTRI